MKIFSFDLHVFLREKIVGGLLGKQKFFGQLQRNSGKIPSHLQKFACSHAYTGSYAVSMFVR